MNHKHFIWKNYASIEENISIKDAIDKQIKFQINRKLRSSLKRQLEVNEFLINWTCYVCKASIEINVKNLLEQQKELEVSAFCCEKHKKEKVNTKLSISWLRYKNLFNKKLQQILNQKWN